MIARIFLPLLAVLSLAFAVVYVERTRRSDEPAPSNARLDVKPAKTIVAGSGVVEPRTQSINVGSPLPGIVVWAIGPEKVGEQVAAGDVLFRLDDRRQKAEVETSRAALDLSKRQLERLKQMPRQEEVDPLAARLAEIKVAVEDQEDRYARALRLYSTRALSLDEFRRNEFAFKAAKQQYRKADADLQLVKKGTWSADLAVAEAIVGQAEQQVKQAEVELERLEVRSAVAGRLLQVNVRPSEFVGSQPGLNLIVLGDVEVLHVRVDIDEDDIPRFRTKAPAVAYLRGDRDRAYTLEFVRVEPFIVPKRSLTRENTERVDTRVLQAIYRINTDGEVGRRIYIGQQMAVYIGDAASGPDTAHIPDGPTHPSAGGPGKP